MIKRCRGKSSMGRLSSISVEAHDCRSAAPLLAETRSDAGSASMKDESARMKKLYQRSKQHGEAEQY